MFNFEINFPVNADTRMIIYEGRSKSNKTRVTAPFIKSVDKR